MIENNIKVSVCLVVYNEDKIIERCLDSIKELADEIILIHDGECNDKTLEIARRYTDRIFVLPHTGDSSLHRVFTYNQAKGEWILQIDADEYIEGRDIRRIKDLIKEADIKGINGYRLQWEMWDGKKSHYVSGFKKEVLFRRKCFHFLGITHGYAYVDGKVVDTDIRLHHRPAYHNLSWKSALRKMKMWAPIHATFYFPNGQYESFQMSPESWERFTEKVRRYPIFYLIKEPLKMTLGQLKNGLILSWAGVNIALQQYVYYTYLYWLVLRGVKENHKSKKILDLGCGLGGNSSFLIKRGEYFGIDILASNIEYAKNRYKNYSFVLYDGFKIPFQDKYFDEIHIYDVLEHVQDIGITIFEFDRVLKKDGRIFITIPAEISEKYLLKLKSDYFSEVGHLRIVDVDDLVSSLTKLNYKLIKKNRVRGVEAIFLSILFRFSKGRVVGFQTGSPLFSSFFVACIWLFDSRLFNTKLKYFFPIYLFTLPIGWLISLFFPKSVYIVFEKR